MSRFRFLLCIALGLLVACGDGPTPTGPVPQPTPGTEEPGIQGDISDAAHNGVNDGFYWLPPMVGDPGVFDAAFNGALSPIVRVCDPAGCATNQIAEFTTTTGPGSETVRVVPEDEHYVVNWHTDQAGVSPGETYRISAHAFGELLGYADVEFAANSREVRNATTNETIGLKDGGTLAIKFRIERGAAAEVFPIDASQGGSIESEDGSTQMDIPSGSLSEDTEIAVEPIDPTDGQLAVVDLGPDGTQFDPLNPPTLTLAFDPASLPAGITAEDLALNLIDPEFGAIVLPGSTVGDGVVSAPIFHFSEVGVGPASRAVFCPGDGRSETFELLEDALAAVNAGATVVVCGLTSPHTVQGVQVDKAVAIEGQAGTRPTLTTSGARFGLITAFDTGTLAIRNLVVETDWDSGSSFGSALLIQDPYDQVVVDDVDFSVRLGGSGVLALTTAVAGAHVTIQNASASGGPAGISVFAFGDQQITNAVVDVQDSDISGATPVQVFDLALTGELSASFDNVNISGSGNGLSAFVANTQDGPGPVVHFRNSSFTGGAAWYQSGASGDIESNTFDDCQHRTCIRVAGPFSGQSQAQPVRVIGNTITATFPDQHETAIWFTGASGFAPNFEIQGNQIVGVVAQPGDRDDPTSYSFRSDAMRIDNPGAAGVVSSNSMSGAYHGITVAGGGSVTGMDNMIAAIHTAVRASDVDIGGNVFGLGTLRLISSDFTDYVVPISADGAFNTGDLSCNWWGDANGPIGVDAGIVADVYTPWATNPVAGLSITSCSGGL